MPTLTQDAGTVGKARYVNVRDQQAGLWWGIKHQAFDPRRPLPKPNRDFEILKADLDCFGFCFVADALSPGEIAAIKARLLEQMDMEEEAGVGAAPLPNGARMNHNLLNKGEVFLKTLCQDLVDELVAHLLGDGFLLHGLNAIETVPGSKAQGLHFDLARLGFPPPMPMVANAVYMLDDFTEENGATRVVPGSHLWDPDKRERMFVGVTEAQDHNPPGTIPAAAPAGTCLVFDGRLMHAAGANVSDAPRAGVFAYYCLGWIRTILNPFLSIPDDLMMTFPTKLRDQLGYKPWYVFGSFEAAGVQAPMDVVRPTEHLRELRRAAPKS